MAPIDKENTHIPEEVSYYAKEIFDNEIQIEKKYTLECKDYMKNQNDVNEKMRAILIDWLIDVHLKFKLVEETLFLCINLIDRFLEKV